MRNKFYVTFERAFGGGKRGGETPPRAGDAVGLRAILDVRIESRNYRGDERPAVRVGACVLCDYRSDERPAVRAGACVL